MVLQVYRLDAYITICYRKQASYLFDCHKQKTPFRAVASSGRLVRGLMFFPWQVTFQFSISRKYPLVIEDIAINAFYRFIARSVSTVRHGSRSLYRHREISSVYFAHRA